MKLLNRGIIVITLKNIFYILFGYIVLNLIFILFNNTYISNLHLYSICITSLFCSCLLLYFSYKNSSELKKFSLITGMGIFSYLLATIFEFVARGNSTNITSLTFYTLSSIFLCISIWMLVIENSAKWKRIYITLDTLIYGILLFYIGWCLFYKNFLPNITYWNFHNITVLNYLNLSLISFLGFLTLCQLNTVTPEVNFLTYGFKIYTMTELIYYYLYIKNGFTVYNPITSFLCNLGWEVGLLLISLSTYCLSQKESFTYKNITTEITPNEIKNNLPLPLFLLFLFSIAISKNVFIILFFIFIIVVRQVSLKYILTYVTNTHLNQQYKIINTALEESLKSLKNKNDDLYTLANIDTLTNLPNRRNFIEYLDNLILNKGPEDCFALLFLDLDRFKSINDWYGHDIGDSLLLNSSERLQNYISENDFLARLGGDEFALILEDINNKSHALKKAHEIVEIFRAPFVINGMKLVSTVSIGISVYPLCDTLRSNLMKYSDIALFNVKKNGKNNCEIYNDKLKEAETRKLEIENKLYDSILNNELTLYFQPQVNSFTGELMGLEALVRWINPDLGFVSPMEFISIAEENGFIISLGNWVIDEAISKIKFINENYNPNIKVGINVSPKQFILSDLTNCVSSSLNKYNVNPECVDIEITESCSIQNEEEAIEKLHTLKELGVKISVDDFGTGYSSLMYLKRYPIDTLKIALELVRNIETNSENYNIVKAIISMCTALNLNTIAEGVEFEDQLNILKSLGCNEIQGYYFGKPMTFNDIIKKYFSK